MSAVGINAGTGLAAATGGADEISQRLESLPASTPHRISSAGWVSCENAMPKMLIASAAPQMIHLRSSRSAKLAASSGAIG